MTLRPGAYPAVIPVQLLPRELLFTLLQKVKGEPVGII